MDNILNKFYVGNTMNSFTHGPYNQSNKDYQQILSHFKYPSVNTNSINQFFSKTQKTKSPHPDYVPQNDTLPKLEKNSVDFSKSQAQPIHPMSAETYGRFDNYGFMNSQEKSVPDENFSPELVRMQMLEDKIKRLEYKSRLDLENNMKTIQDKFIGDGRFKKFLDEHKDDPLIQQNKLQEQQPQQNVIQSMPNLPPIQNPQYPQYPYQQYPQYPYQQYPQYPYQQYPQYPYSYQPYPGQDPSTLPEAAEENNEEKKGKKRKHKHRHNHRKSTEEISLFAGSSADFYESPKFSVKKSVVQGSPGSIRRGSVAPGTLSIGGGGNSIRGSILRRSSIYSPMTQIISPTQTQVPNHDSIIQLNQMITEPNRIATELGAQNDKINGLVESLAEELDKFKEEIPDRLNVLDYGFRGKIGMIKEVISTGGNYKMKKAYHKIIEKEKTDYPEEEKHEIEKEEEYEKEVRKCAQDKINEYINFREEEDTKKMIEEERAENKRRQLLMKYQKYKKEEEKKRRMITVKNQGGFTIESTNNIHPKRTKTKKKQYEEEREFNLKGIDELRTEDTKTERSKKNKKSYKSRKQSSIEERSSEEDEKSKKKKKSNTESESKSKSKGKSSKSRKQSSVGKRSSEEDGKSKKKKKSNTESESKSKSKGKSSKSRQQSSEKKEKKSKKSKKKSEE